MKHVNTIKRLFSFALALLMVFSMMPQITLGASAVTLTGGEKLYLKPSSNWSEAGAWFAAYFCNGTSAAEWVKMTDGDGDDVYEVTVPSGKNHKNVIFCRMNPASNTMDWSNKWSQTGDLTYDGTKNCYNVSGWDKGSWGTYTPPAAPVEHTYTVAGDSTAVFGTAWDTANTANDMTEQSAGVYVKVYESVPSGTYKFKVARDYTWAVAYPASDKTITVPKDNSKVTITFTVATQAVDVTVEAPAAPECQHESHNQEGKCTECGEAVSHNFGDNAETCSICGAPNPDHKDEEPAAVDYYLVGFINGADYNGEDYKFAEGKQTVTFTKDSYIAIKETSGDWYLTAEFCADTTGTFAKGNSEKMFVPADTMLAFTLVENADGTLTLSYQVAEEYTVTFDVGDDEVTAPSSQTLYAGDTVTEPATDPVREGYIFGGWYTDAACENAYNFSTPVTTSFTLYAKWTAEAVEPEEPSTITVYFRNDWFWTDVCCYAFDAAGDFIGTAWPGAPMELCDNNGTYDIYKAVIPANAAAIIFNGTKDDGSATDQSPDITDFADGDAFYMHWAEENKCSKFDYTPAGGEEGGEEVEPGETVSYKATFHFMNTLNWATVNLYTWVGTGTQLTGTWPGSAVPAKGGYNTATVEFEAAEGTDLNFIFNNGSTQTIDLSLPFALFTKNDEGIYVAEKYVALTTQTDGKYDAAIVDRPESIVTSPIVDGSSVTFNYGDNSATSVSVAGSFNSWSATATTMTKNAEGVWTVTVNDLLSGNYEYKFVVDGENWVLDPMNSNVVTEADGNQNSAFYILSDASVEDDNTITVRIHYTRADGNYENWNLWVWGSALAGQQVDFAEELVDGAKVATIVLENAREHQNISFKERKSVEGNDWAAEGEKNRSIDLSTIVSGTIDYYIPSGNCVYGDDVIRKNKISSVEMDYDNGVITVTSVQAIPNAEEALKLIKGEEEIDVTITAVGSKYSLTLPESMELELSELYQYQVDYYGDLYSISVNAVYASDRFAAEYTYEGKDLGATYTASATTFRVWAPTAKFVSVNLYASGTKGTDDLTKSVPMTKDVNGTWVAAVEGDLNGAYYTYLVTVDGKTVEAVDPYARTTGVNGNRGMVIDLDSTNPAGWANDKNPNPVSSQTDAVIYELHVRDFSIDDSSGVKDEWQGKYMAFTQGGTTIPGTSTSTGIDYLDALGITHLHLLPVYDYGSVDETKCTNFNWGYDPVNYNVPEGSYSTDPYDGASRVSEFKQMVKSLHDHDISVVMDVVYNHVYNADKFCFNNIVPGYFSRVDSNTSGCGNDTASEREMVSKYIVESVLYWHQEYHIDGFRFDLVGLLDVDTINDIVETVHACCPDVIFYGEGWDMDSTNKEPGTQMAKQGNASKTPGFAYFSDSFRNGVGGSNDGKNTGFASGAGNGAAMATEWMAKPSWTSNPEQVVQYVSCHDNYTLADKIILSTGKSGVDATVIKMNNLAVAFYMTAQGIPFIHAGEELLREKVNPDGSRNHNSYNSPDSVNKIDWNDVTEYADTSAYYKGLIAFRKAHPALRYSTAAEVKANVQTYSAAGNLVVMRVDGNGAGDEDIFFIFNAGTSAQTVELPEGTWTININGEKAGTASLGTASGTVNVAGISAMVLTKEDEGKDESAPVGPSEAKTIYFSNNKHWNTVYAYAWTGETYHLDAWPGTEMTYVETNDYGEKIYSIDLPASEDGIEGLVFHNNSGAQTVDVVPGVDGTGYYCADADAEGKFAVGTYTYRAPVVGGADEYYLHGRINNADYVGTDYKFGEDGTVTATFAADSYVYVTNGDGTETYMTDGYKGAVQSVIMKDTAKHTLTGEKWDKFLIPGGDEVVITMVKNDDNTVTLSYKSSTTAFEDKSGVQKGVTLHAWNWSFDNITANMAKIAEQGYTAIQTSPIQVMKEATNGAENSVGSHWWVYYQPVDFVITTDNGNALGTKTDFAEMCAAAEQYGIQVIVDVVANHLGNKVDNKTGNDLADAVPEYLRKDEYWHDITVDITDWNNRYNMTQYCLDGLPDLNTANKEIQGYVLDFLKECVDAGADGFRFDMAKSIETPKDDASFASDFWPTVVGGIQEYAGNDLYIYGEILDDAKIAISAYTQYMSVTDNGWGNHMRSLVASGTAALAQGFYKSAPATNLVIWAESHDTFATDDKSQSSAAVSVENINKTWALVAARKDAMGLYLARPASMDQALGVASVTGWANAEVKAVNEFHNDFAAKSETVGNSGKFAYVVRGNDGIVIVNTAGTTTAVELTVAMADGTYTDNITGNTFTVADGVLTGSIGTTGIAVVCKAEESSAVAKIGDQKYETLAEALSAAKPNETIVLLKDVETEDLVLFANNTLDLNGYTLNATGFAAVYADNHIVDNVGGGLLKGQYIMIDDGNKALPIWDDVNGGYALAKKPVFNEKETESANSVLYQFLPRLTPAEYELIAQGTETSGVTMKVKVSWMKAIEEGKEIPAFVTFAYTDKLMEQFVDNIGEDGKFGKIFTLSLTGTEGKELTFQVYFESASGVKLFCN